MRMCGKEHKYNWYNQKKIIELFEENTRSNIRPVDVTQVIRREVGYRILTAYPNDAIGSRSLDRILTLILVILYELT